MCTLNAFMASLDFVGLFAYDIAIVPYLANIASTVFTWLDAAPQLVAALRGAHNRLWK